MSPNLLPKIENFLKIAVPAASGVLAAGVAVLYVISGPAALATRIAGGAALGGILLSAALNRNLLAAFFRKSSSRKGAGRLAQTALLAGIFVLVYLLAGGVPLKIDLTGGRLYALSEETRTVLKGVTNELTALYFRPAGMEGPHFEYQENLLKTYAERNPNIRVRRVDPYENRALAVDYGVKEDAVVVFEYLGNKIQVPFRKMVDQDQDSGKFLYRGEEAYTAALKSLTLSKPKTVYALSGHGEINPGDKSSRGHREIFDRLEKDNIRARPLDLLKTTSIPDDCSLIIIGNPVQSLTADELDRVNRYLADGGSVLVLLEFETHVTVNDILRRMGLFFLRNLVVEDSGDNPQFGRATVVPRLSAHGITAPLARNNIPVVMPTAVGIQELPEKLRNGPDRYEITPLLTTSRGSYGETSKNEIVSGQVTRDKKDLPGPLTAGWAARRFSDQIMTGREGDVTNTVESRLVVFGDSDFVNNANADRYGNSDLFLNAVNFLLHREGSITIRPKTAGYQSFQLTGSERRFLNIFAYAVAALYFIPGLVIVLRRRRKVKE